MHVENVINDLVGYKNLKIIQCNKYFNFSLDSILLPNFVKLSKNVTQIMDLGCGNAPIPLILSTKTKAKLYGIEIQKEIFDLAIQSVNLNKLEKQIEIKNLNIKDLNKYFEAESMDTILSNPPYFKKLDTSILNNNDIKTNARHETLVNLEDIIRISSFLLKGKGNLALVHRTERLAEIIDLMLKYKIQPKRIRFVYPKIKSDSNIVLIEGIKNGNIGLKVEFPLIVHDESSNYTSEVLKMFE